MQRVDLRRFNSEVSGPNMSSSFFERWSIFFIISIANFDMISACFACGFGIPVAATGVEEKE